MLSSGDRHKVHILAGVQAVYALQLLLRLQGVTGDSGRFWGPSLVNPSTIGGWSCRKFYSQSNHSAESEAEVVKAL